MRNKYKIRVVLLFVIPADQYFLLRLQIIRILDLSMIFLRNLPLRLVKTNGGDSVRSRQLHSEQLKLLFIFPLKQCHDGLQQFGFHRHDILKSVNVSHLKIKACILIQMTRRIMLLCAKYGRRLIDPIKYAYEHLFIKLRTL